MAEYKYTIRLVADAEPGTGLGDKVVDNLASRNHNDELVLRSTHVKGLIRDEVRKALEHLNWNRDLEDAVFGKPADDESETTESVIRITDAVCRKSNRQDSRTLLVSRTSIGEHGSAMDHSFRTTESIPVGYEFEGTIECLAEKESCEDLAWRFGLRAMRAVGGGRNRGSGLCVTSIAGDERMPGKLLKDLESRISKWKPAPVTRNQTAQVRQFSGETKVLRIKFTALSPVCCPENTNASNSIVGGFAIPASAVQGALLTQVRQSDPAWSEGLFQSGSFRCWPLYPTPPNGCYASRVPLTLKFAKTTPKDGGPIFQDDFVGQEQRPAGDDFKFKDGVVFGTDNQNCTFWNQSEMARTISGHGVIHDRETKTGRNLFTVEAMAPTTWTGLVAIPAECAEEFTALISQRNISIGKSRSVQGLGKVSIDEVSHEVPEFRNRYQDRTVLVVQSPIMLPDEAANTDEQLKALVRRAFQLDEDVTIEVRQSVGIKFGWNRSGGKDGKIGIQKACRVSLPGSVIVIEKHFPDDQVKTVLLKGLGDGRERGFGSVMTYPGIVSGTYSSSEGRQRKESSDDFKKGMSIVLNLNQKKLPSPSQIRAVLAVFEKSGKVESLQYLQQQTERTERIWFTWKPIVNQIESILNLKDADAVRRCLKVLSEMALIAQQKTRKNK